MHPATIKLPEVMCFPKCALDALTVLTRPFSIHNFWHCCNNHLKLESAVNCRAIPHFPRCHHWTQLMSIARLHFVTCSVSGATSPPFERGVPYQSRIPATQSSLAEYAVNPESYAVYLSNSLPQQHSR